MPEVTPDSRVEQMFIRSDLKSCGSDSEIAFYRLPPNMRQFIDLCRARHGEVEGIVLKLDEGEVDFTIGFIIPPAKPVVHVDDSPLTRKLN